MGTGNSPRATLSNTHSERERSTIGTNKKVFYLFVDFVLQPRNQGGFEPLTAETDAKRDENRPPIVCLAHTVLI